jgi:hypothetical protein
VQRENNKERKRGYQGTAGYEQQAGEKGGTYSGGYEISFTQKLAFSLRERDVLVPPS